MECCYGVGGQTINAQRILVEKPFRKRLLGRLGRKSEHNIMMSVSENER
jgi:hypothetical protein